MTLSDPNPTQAQHPRWTWPVPVWRAAAAAALLGASMAGPAAAADLHWSIGIQQPGVQVVVSQWPPAPVVLVPVHRVVLPPPPVYRASWEPPGHARQYPHGHRDGHGRHAEPRGHWKAERHHHRHDHRDHRDERHPWQRHHR